jgi:hypothetical protein
MAGLILAQRVRIQVVVRAFGVVQHCSDDANVEAFQQIDEVAAGAHLGLLDTRDDNRSINRAAEDTRVNGGQHRRGLEQHVVKLGAQQVD